jgi:hypothetical protein
LPLLINWRDWYRNKIDLTGFKNLLGVEFENQNKIYEK